MAKLGKMTLTGESGTEYEFSVYPANTNWKSGYPCVYYVSRRTEKSGGGGSHTKIYIGQTDDIQDRFEDHHNQHCFDLHEYNAISVHYEPEKRARLRIETDLIRAMNPPCNG